MADTNKQHLWKVVGGLASGGIIVRSNRDTKSTAYVDRLSSGAKISQLALEGSRLSYELVEGSGPAAGWVSLQLGGKDLVVAWDEDDDVKVQPELSSAGDVPRQLLPACDIAAAGLEGQILGPFRPAPNMKEAKRRAQLRMPGDMYGLPLPATPQEFQSQDFGAAWLTKALHAAGTLPRDNLVVKIVSAENFPGGGSGPKTLFTIEYQKSDILLDTVLFMKLPAVVGAIGSGVSSASQRVQDMQGAFGDIWGAEIQFYRFVSQHIPFPVPKFYFGDLSRESMEACVINAAVRWPAKGQKFFLPYGVLPPCEKCEDYVLKSSQDYYFAMLRQLGLVAGLDRVGRLGPEIDDIHWSPYGPNSRGIPPEMIQTFPKFVKEIAPQIWPESAKSQAFLESFMKIMNMVAQGFADIDGYLYSNPLYIGFGHQNGNTDNAYFFRDTAGVMNAGIFDWGSAGRMAYGQEFMGAFGSCLAEMLAEYDDRLVQCFVDAYHSTGAPELDAQELILHYRLAMAMSTCTSLAGTMAFCSEKHALGRPMWKTVKAYNDDKIRSDFSLKFGVSMLYNRVVLWSLRLDSYSDSIMAWADKMGSS